MTQTGSTPLTKTQGPVQDSASTRPAGGSERILAATVEALSELDASALSVQRICDRAGVTAPTLYHHFGSKDGLLAVAIDRMLTDWIGLFDRLGERSRDMEALADQAVEGWVQMITAPSRPVSVFVWIAMWSTESREVLIRARDQAHAVIRDALTEQVGHFDTVDDLAAVVLDGVLAAAVDFQIDADEHGLRRRLTTMAAVAAHAARSAAAPASPPS